MTDETLVKTSCENTEKFILGSMLCNIENASKGIKSFSENDFHHQLFKNIFKAIKNDFLEKNDIDLTSISRKIEGDHDLNGVDSFSFIQVLQLDGEQVHFESQADDLKRWTVIRQLLNLTRTLGNDLKRNADPYKILEKIKDTIDGIEKNKLIKDEAFKYLLESNSKEKLIEELRKISPGIATGFTIGEENITIPGGAISVVAMPTSHGKTATLINFSIGTIKHNHDKSVYFFTYEESEAIIQTLFINTYIDKEISKNNRKSIKDYFISGNVQFTKTDMKENFPKESEAFFRDVIDTKKLRVVYSNMSAEELVSAIHFIKKNTNVGLVCIDYMQLLRLLKWQGSRQEELKKICLMLKDCAIETGLPILIGAQFNREVVAEADLSPTKIGEAGDIERIANLIIGGWNRNFVGFSRQGNVTRDGKPVLKEEAIYLEIMKGRAIGNGHNSILNFDGNTGKLSNRSNDSDNSTNGVPKRIKK